MARASLGISWVHGRFQAVASLGGRNVGAWTCPRPVLEGEDFDEALGEAVRETGFTGTRVVVVLEHRSLLFHVQETPPAKGRLLEQLLQRLVSQSRFFEERAAWSCVEVPGLKGRQRYLLALLPDPLVRQMALACSARRLQLVAVVPIAAVLAPQLRELAVGKDQVVVLTTESAGSLQLLLGRGDGQVFFSRNVVLSGAQQQERAAQEINRTLHYAQQQFGAVVNDLFVFGERALAGLSGASIRDGLTVRASPVPDVPFHFASQAAQLPAKTPFNLVNPAENRKRQGRQLAAAAMLALVTGTAATVLLVEQTVRARELWASSREQELDKQDQTQQAVLARQREARRLAAFVQYGDVTNHVPVPELLARSLGAHLPGTIRLSEVQVARVTNGWSFALQGFVQDQAGGMLVALETLERDLEEGLFSARVLDSTRRRSLRGGPDETSPTPSRAGARANEKPFFVSGLIE